MININSISVQGIIILKRFKKKECMCDTYPQNFPCVTFFFRRRLLDVIFYWEFNTK